MAQINASIDNVSYDNINKIVVGGKNILLSAIESGGDLPANVAEIVAGSYTPESNIYQTTSFTHGCSGTPDIIILWTDYKTFFSASKRPTNTNIVAAKYDAISGTKEIFTVPSTYEGTANSSTCYYGAIDSTNDGLITDVGETTFSFLCKANRKFDAGLHIQWLAIRLQGVS